MENSSSWQTFDLDFYKFVGSKSLFDFKTGVKCKSNVWVVHGCDKHLLFLLTIELENVTFDNFLKLLPALFGRLSFFNLVDGFSCDQGDLTFFKVKLEVIFLLKLHDCFSKFMVKLWILLVGYRQFDWVKLIKEALLLCDCLLENLSADHSLITQDLLRQKAYNICNHVFSKGTHIYEEAYQIFLIASGDGWVEIRFKPYITALEHSLLLLEHGIVVEERWEETFLKSKTQVFLS
jgi:hypothetical protein